MPVALPARYLGTQLDDRYRLDRLIGEGASSWVFAGHDLRLEREVAIKLLKPGTSSDPAASRQHFLTEGRTLAKLVHPHVVLVYDAGENADGLRYLVTELSGTDNLEVELIQRGKLPVEACLRLLLPLMGALAWCHDRGIVHRDLKPANIVLVQERRELRAKLLDFGIAARQGASSSSDAVCGTPAYMAPEQARGETHSPAVDVWALGVVFFRCLTGRLPFDGSGSLATMSKLVHERAPRFSACVPELSARLGLALDRALEPEPRRRYASMRSFAHAVAAACTQDNVVLPHDPDPLGLPDFATWVSMADVDTTRPLESEVRDQLFAPLRAAGAFLWYGKSRRALTLALPLLGVLGVQLVASQMEAAPRKERALMGGTPQWVAPISAPAKVPPASSPERQVLAPAPGCDPQPARVNSPSRRPGARAKPAATAHETAVQPPELPARTPDNEASDLVTSWDW